MNGDFVSDAQRQLRDAPWPISFLTFSGEHIQSSFGNLLDLLMQRERFVCDSNSSWKTEAGKIDNSSKAFIVGHTALDEQDDVEGNIFGKKVDIANENIFFFTTAPYQNGSWCLSIEQYTSKFEERFDGEQLRRASQKRIKKTDADYLKAETELLERIRSEKENILSVLGAKSLVDLPTGEKAEKTRIEMIQFVRSKGPACFKDFQNSMNVAGFCFVILLLEQDEVGKKTRLEFSDPKNRNLFGDTLLVRDALWFGARILSNDRAVRRVAEYIAMPEIRVVGML